MESNRLIGGFLEFERLPRQPDSLAERLGLPANATRTFANARSALSSFLRSRGVKRLWLPAYGCPSLTDAATLAGVEAVYFGVGVQLEPDVSTLARDARAGDAVLAIDYFGRPPGAAFKAFASSRSDLLLIEDAVQALDTGEPPWGGWCLHSPRKLVGVADGGFLSPAGTIGADAQSTGPGDPARWRAAMMRLEDTQGTTNALWHGVNQARERRERVSSDPMSTLSAMVLHAVPSAPVARARHENYSGLAISLGDLAFLGDASPSFVPFGFPIRLPGDQRDRVAAALADRGVFAAVHWRTLAAPPCFKAEHALSRELLTLPCDQRYTPEDMARVAEVVASAVGLS